MRSRNLPVEIARILPELSSEVSEPEAHVDAEQARFRLFDAVATLLREAAREHPIVIVLDDLHEADTASLQMLQFTARVLHDANVLIIGTYREAEMRRSTGTLAADGRDRSRRSRAADRRTDGDVKWVIWWPGARRALPPPESWPSCIARPPGTRCSSMACSGRSRPRAGSASGARIDLAGFKLPDSVRGAIRRRLGLLSPDARAVLTTAAVIGQESEHELLCAGPRAHRGEARGADGRGGGDGNRRRRGTIVIPFYASAVARGALR